MSEKFLYFAYGSNMLAKRIHHNNPKAVQKCIGKLMDHRLDFNRFTKRWQGCVATIIPHTGSEVWGVIWEIDKSNMDTLDKQEGVHDNIYLSKDVNIFTNTGQNVQCKLYQQCQVPEVYVGPKNLPSERQPSYVYWNIIVTGAQDHQLPENYIDYLKSFPHNGYNGETQVECIIPSGNLKYNKVLKERKSEYKSVRYTYMLDFESVLNVIIFVYYLSSFLHFIAFSYIFWIFY